jgi:uncharacterized damage-inducible protein DinB
MSPFIKEYALKAVETNAVVISRLLSDIDENSQRWDMKPDAERFSLREIVAHLVDYDEVTRARFEHVIREDNPTLEDWDPTEAAKHYDARNPKHQLENLLLSRTELKAWLEGLSAKEWKMTGTRPRVGEFSVEEGVVMFLGHDAYHIEQITAWLEATK